MAGFDSERRRKRFMAEARRDKKRIERSWRVFKLTKEQKRIERELVREVLA